MRRVVPGGGGGPPVGAAGVSGTDPHRVLILSGSIGKGHDTVAAACASALEAAGSECEIVDCMALLGGLGNRLGEGVMRTLMAIPGAYDAFHFAYLRPGGRVARGADMAAARKLLNPIRKILRDRPADVLLSVFATGGAVAHLLLPELPGVESVVYCTDACPHAMWVHARTRLFLVTSPMSAAFVRYHRPDAQVSVVPPAVRPGFYDAPSREAARQILGVEPEGPVVLLMAGAWGIGPLDRLASVLVRDGVTVLAVAGANERLYRRLQAVAAGNPRIRAYGYSEQIPELMSAADVVVTTPGDTCTEARQLGRPMVLLDTVPGHGRENLELELARGAATAVPANPEVVRDAVRVALKGQIPPASERPAQREEWARTFLASLAPVGITLPTPS